MADINNPASDAKPQLTLAATYTSTSGNEPFSATRALSAPLAAGEDGAVESRTKYLRDLRAAAAEVQDQVNKELTARMEEDNRRAGAGTGADDTKEEENYGEEVQEDED